MKKRQWRMLITEILETRNDASTQHAFMENRLAEIDIQLNAIRRRLPPEPDMDLRTYEIMPDGSRRECEP